MVERPKSGKRVTDTELVSGELVARCKSGDEAAWSELVEATHRQVYTLCLRILRDPDDAAEATQDAYLKAWRGLDGFRGEAMFSTWLYRVASSAAISKQRGRKRTAIREMRVEEEALAQIAAPGSVEVQASARLDLQAVEGALRSLPDHYRTVVVLRDVYGLAINEIAAELKISQTAAKVRLHRARKTLKNIAFEEGAEG